MKTALSPPPFPQNQTGWATLSAALLLAAIATSASYYTSRASQIELIANNNHYQNRQALTAADAGLEHGTKYLSNNKSIIIVDTDNDGNLDSYTDSSITNVALSNSSQYTISFSNPQVNNLDLITVTATGISADGTGNKAASQNIAFQSTLDITPPTGLIARNDVNLSGNLSVSNTETDFTIWSGGNVGLTGSASTLVGNGDGSDKFGLSDDVQANDNFLADKSSDEFFEYVFNAKKSSIKDNADLNFSNTSDTNYSDALTGQTGKVIWIDQASGEARINSNITIGSTAQPVILIVDGELHVNGNVTIHGVVFVDQDWNNSGGGNLIVNGGVIVNGSLSGTGTPNISFDSTTLGNVKTNLGTWNKVSGSWRDF